MIISLISELIPVYKPIVFCDSVALKTREDNSKVASGPKNGAVKITDRVVGWKISWSGSTISAPNPPITNDVIALDESLQFSF